MRTRFGSPTEPEHQGRAIHAHWAIALVWLSVWGGACAGQKAAVSPSPAFETKAYAPLAVGASWTYAMQFPGQRGEMTVRVVEKKDGFFVDDRNGAFKHTASGLRDRSRFLIRTPLVAGRTWKSIVSPSAVEHYKIASVGGPCDSQAGTFGDCLVVESSLRRDKNVTLRIRWTWARGIGLVKIETEADIQGRGVIPQTRQSLLRYSLDGGTKRARAGAPSAPVTDDGPDTWTR